MKRKHITTLLIGLSMIILTGCNIKGTDSEVTTFSEAEKLPLVVKEDRAGRAIVRNVKNIAIKYHDEDEIIETTEDIEEPIEEPIEEEIPEEEIYIMDEEESNGSEEVEDSNIEDITEDEVICDEEIIEEAPEEEVEVTAPTTLIANENEKIISYSPLVYWEGNYPNNVEYFLNAISKCDQRVVNKFIERGGYFVLTDRNTLRQGHNSQSVAYTSYDVYDMGGLYNIHIVMSDRIDDIDDALVHELGHFVELHVWADGDRNWINIFNIEGRNITSYGATNMQEFFAEAYALYYRNPAELQRVAPMAYAYIENALATSF